MTDTPAIHIRHLSVTFNHVPVLEDISLDIREGSYVGILGPNGAGKSTLLKVILGLLTPSQGDIRVFGESPDKLRRTGKLIGYLPQRPLTNPRFPVSVLDVVLMGRYGRIGPVRRPSREDVAIARLNLDRMGILPLADRLIGELSGDEAYGVALNIVIDPAPGGGLYAATEAGLFKWVPKSQ